MVNCSSTYIKGTQHVESQILETVCIKQSLPYIAETHLLTGSKEEKFYHHMTSTKHISDRDVHICGNHRSLGLINQTSALSDPVHQHALLGVTKSTHLGIFSRAAIGSCNCVFHSIQHTQAKSEIITQWHITTMMNLIVVKSCILICY